LLDLLALYGVNGLHGGAGVYAENEIADRRQHHCANAAAAERHRTQTAPVLDIAATAPAQPIHPVPSDE
jgi:uncharacterized protein YbjT (DUF2867 family)